MPTSHDQWLKEAQAYITGGVSSAFAPEYIESNQLAWARNTSCRDGLLKPRSGYHERSILTKGKVQGVEYYSRHGGMLVAMINGLLFRIKPNTSTTFAVESISLDFPNCDIESQAYMVECSSSLVIQNGIDTAIKYDGADAVHVNKRGQVPRGKHMAYANGRLWVHNGRGRMYVGDIAGVATDSELNFTETTYLLGGGYFALPGEATGMQFIPINDSETGYGPLLVFGRDYVIAFRADITQRDLWQQTQGFQTVVLPHIGCISDKSIVAFNQDIYWRDGKGEIRSLRQARIDSSTPGIGSLSKEVSFLIDQDSTNLLDNCPSMIFDNRLLIGASPFINIYGETSYKDVVSMDMAPTTTMKGKSSPVYDGEWDGISVTHMVKGYFDGIERAFMVTLDQDDNNRLFEIMPKDRRDIYYLSGTATPQRIKRVIDTRKFLFQSGQHYKRLDRVDFWATDINGLVDVKVYYKKDFDSQFTYWDTIQFCSKTTDASTAAPHVFKQLGKRNAPHIRTLTAPTANMVGQDFQLRLEIDGDCVMDRIILHADKNVTHPVYADRQDYSTCTETIVDLQPMNYEIPYTDILFNLLFTNGTGVYTNVGTIDIGKNTQQSDGTVTFNIVGGSFNNFSGPNSAEVSGSGTGPYTINMNGGNKHLILNWNT